MGNYENIVKLEEMRRLMHESNMQSAQKVLDTMELKKIKNMSDLSLIAEVYAENERYEEAAELYLKIYDKTKTRKSLFQLIDLSIKRNKAEDAQYYLASYLQIAPKDFYKYIFRYRIDKLKGEPYEKLIETLDMLKKTEYMEQWAYELAKTYYKAGMGEDCIRECSDIILWFGEGTYVEKAKMLRSYYSGEAGKENIMEELKRRANLEGSNTLEPEQILTKDEVEKPNEAYDKVEEPNEAYDEVVEEKLDEAFDDMVDTGRASESEEEIYSASDFMVEEETEAFEFGLKKDVQDILTEDWEEEPAYETQEEERNSKSEKDLAEQEVEDAIYQLLQEEDMDEEDKKLKQIAKDFLLDTEEIFGNFLHVKSVKKQLVKSLESILDDHTKTVLIIITGTVGSGKTTLAKDMTIFLNKVGKLKSSKIAKIKAEKLNNLDVLAKKETLKDCCLVIENASELKRKTIDSLLELSQCLQGDIAVIFEENKKNMNKLFRECPKLMDLFKNRIHLPQYTQEDLMGFANACLKQKQYSLNSKAESILLNKINKIARQSEQQRHLEEIYNLMELVMNAADLRTGKRLSELSSQGRLKDVDILSVLPEDFITTP